MTSGKKFADIIRHFVDNGVRWLGPFFVFMALALIFCVVYVLLSELLPYYTTTFVSPFAIFHLLLSSFLLFNILFNYYMCIFTPPGSTPDLHPDEVAQVEALLKSEQNISVKRGEGFSKVCKFCKKPKPPRSHHCHICRRCVLRMDHHCPWVSNCVGFYNHRYFVLFLLYLCCGCFYVTLMSFFPFYASYDYRTPYVGSRTAVLFVFVMSLSIMVAVGLLLAWHLYLVITAQTTIEFYYNRNRIRHAQLRGETFQNEYDLGFEKNWKVFFGATPLWFLPSQKPLPPGDGLVYLTRSENTKTQGVNHHFV